MKSAPSRRLRTGGAALAAILFGGTFLSVASPAVAAVQSPPDFNRAQVALRAEAWVRYRVPYSQTSWYNGYRQDCSGFVSMAWSLGKSYVTWTFPEVAKPIGKNDLTLGDMLLDQTGESQHSVIFDKWANPQKTAYWEWELAGSTRRPVHRVVPYPFWTADRNDYKPYRFVGAPRYTGKGSQKRTAKAAAPKVTSVAPAKPAAEPKKAAPAPPKAGSAKAKPRAVAKPTPRKAEPAPRPAPAGKSSRVPDRKENTVSEPFVLVLLRTVVAWLAD